MKKSVKICEWYWEPQAKHGNSPFHGLSSNGGVYALQFD